LPEEKIFIKLLQDLLVILYRIEGNICIMFYVFNIQYLMCAF